ncbi:MAG TPA: MarR family winged helix-turn-helix transcriptional regulator [Nitrospiria bacterium]|nr:MarR family winged helix-turn-helix transcriptional regulator [Nitrospiria bacterium]
MAVRLRLLTRAVTKLYNQALRPYGLTTSQMNILVAVSCLGDAKQREVCHALHLEKSSLSRDLTRMRAQGWIDEVQGEDGRAILLRVTPAGKRLLEKAFPAWQKAQDEAKALLGEKEVNSFARAAKSVRAKRASGKI